MRDAAPFLFDTHVHLDAFPLAKDLAEEVRRARRAGIGHFVVPGVERSGWRRILEIAQVVDGVWAAPGLHPLATGEWCPECERELQRLLVEPKVVAIGEIGLDALLPSPSLAVQEQVFRAQLRLAIAVGRPALIHCRQATERLLRILREEGAERVGGIFHAFSGSLETACLGIRLGFAIGVGGTVTYPSARRLPEVVRKVPADWLVLETDAPDLSPHPHRGEVNRPAWLSLVARRVAELRGWSEEETARITTENAKRILRLNDDAHF
jgi:TatD DNase family protein